MIILPLIVLTGQNQSAVLKLDDGVYDRILIINPSTSAYDFLSGGHQVRIQPGNADMLTLAGALLRMQPQVIQTFSSTFNLEIHAYAKGEEFTDALPMTGFGTIPPLSRWNINASPVTGSRATATRAAATGVQHVGDSGIAVLATTVAIAGAPPTSSLAIIDGASGGPSVFFQINVEENVPAGSNVIVGPLGPGLNFRGTVGNAMTIEWNVGQTSIAESVSLAGFDQ